jgi:hypothetical protein
MWAYLLWDAAWMKQEEIRIVAVSKREDEPTLTQVPPKASVDSIKATFAPYEAARRCDRLFGCDDDEEKECVPSHRFHRFHRR